MPPYSAQAPIRKPIATEHIAAVQDWIRKVETLPGLHIVHAVATDCPAWPYPVSMGLVSNRPLTPEETATIACSGPIKVGHLYGGVGGIRPATLLGVDKREISLAAITQSVMAEAAPLQLLRSSPDPYIATPGKMWLDRLSQEVGAKALRHVARAISVTCVDTIDRTLKQQGRGEGSADNPISDRREIRALVPIYARFGDQLRAQRLRSLVTNFDSVAPDNPDRRDYGGRIVELVRGAGATHRLEYCWDRDSLYRPEWPESCEPERLEMA